MNRADQELLSRAVAWAHMTVTRLGLPPEHPLHDDAAQQALLKLSGAVAKFDADQIAWRTYAIMVMRRSVMDFREYHGRRETVQTDDAPEVPTDLGPAVDPAEVIESRELPRMYRRALRAGGEAAPLGLPESAAERVIECSRRRVEQLLADRSLHGSRSDGVI